MSYFLSFRAITWISKFSSSLLQWETVTQQDDTRQDVLSEAVTLHQLDEMKLDATDTYKSILCFDTAK